MNDSIAALSLADRRYSTVAIAFHWIIATLIFVNLLLGFFHEDFSKPTMTRMLLVHMSIGLTVLALTVLRLLWRIAHRPPPFEEVLKPWEAFLARITHWLFYALLLIIPITGWLLPSTRGYSISYLGLIPIGPLPVTQSAGAHEFWGEMHELFAFAILGLLVLHVAGALKHHFQGHRQVIGRMAPFLGRRA